MGGKRSGKISMILGNVERDETAAVDQLTLKVNLQLKSFTSQAGFS